MNTQLYLRILVATVRSGQRRGEEPTWLTLLIHRFTGLMIEILCPLRRGNTAGNPDFQQELKHNADSPAKADVVQAELVDRRNGLMRTLLASSTVLLTIIFCVALGIACGYAVITAILQALSQKPRKAANASATAVISITSAHSH
jgi:hypothetical protein